MASRKLRVFSDNDVNRVADTYHKWRNVGKGYADIEGFSKAAMLSEVQKQDYKLTPGIYVGTEAEEDDGILFEDKMKALTGKLYAQFKESEALEKKITENLKTLGYGN